MGSAASLPAEATQVTFSKDDFKDLLQVVDSSQKNVAACLSKAGVSLGEAPKQPAPTAEAIGLDQEAWRSGKLSVTVLGATGDLAKKETFPALLDLFAHDYLQHEAVIVGYARKEMTTESFREYLSEVLLKSHVCQEMPETKDSIPAFLKKVHYFAGSYDSVDAMAELDKLLTVEEERFHIGDNDKQSHRVFYFAIPPFVFQGAAKAIKEVAMAKGGSTRLIIEKPFGHDLTSAKELQEGLSGLFKEEEIYRMDHFLGYEICQNILAVRFGNQFLEPLMNNKHVAAVRVTLKEDFGTEGRGGYFTKYGIIRDVIQNHLLQMLCLVAMERPGSMDGEPDIRDRKVELLKAMEPFDPCEVVLGQYVGAKGKPGYLEDDSIKEADREMAKKCPTFCQMIVRINNERWKGVNFIVRAGKAIDECKCEIRVQFKEAEACGKVFGEQWPKRNELVLRVSPGEAIYMKMSVKSPGLSMQLMQSEMDLSYAARYPGIYCPSAYTRLILAGIRGQSESFVRDDELMCSWELFTPFLEKIADFQTQPYPYGSRGPEVADKVLELYGYEKPEGYCWRPPHQPPAMSRLMTR